MSKDEACPFCGSNEIELRQRRGAYDYDSIYCNGCKTEFTYYPPHIAITWNRRVRGDGECCPFCGGMVEFDGSMNWSYLFADAYCPRCHMRFEFQRVTAAKTTEKTIAKARKAFAHRAVTDDAD